MLWRAYYAEGETADGEDRGDWLALRRRPRGLLAVVHPDPVQGRVVEDGEAFYFWPGWAEHPWACDLYGALDYLLTLGVIREDTVPSDLPPHLFFDHGIYWGRSVNNAEWHGVRERIRADPDLWDRSAFAPRERRA